MNKSDSDLLDDLYVADKTYEPRILEGESSSYETYEEKHGNVCTEKTILDHLLQSKSPQPISSVATNGLGGTVHRGLQTRRGLLDPDHQSISVVHVEALRPMLGEFDPAK
ncbi:hypothetical protein TNCV_1433981 [Trichonephila clavipes]|nr:hypothetical protein TNCV_1433981 [Trichonephila clavipes]